MRRGDLSSIPAGQFMLRPHEMGKIKIGRLGQARKAQSGREYQQPEKLDHFIITHKHRDTTGNFVVDTDAMRAIGDPEPKRLRVFLPYQDPNLNLVVFYAAYVKSRCMCRGNGTVGLRFNEKTSSYDEITCKGEDCKKYQDKGCKLTGLLSVVLADVPRVGGVHLFRTTSFYSISSLQASMNMLLTQTEGNISGVPLELVIRPDVRQPTEGTKVTIYTVNLEYAGTIASLRSSALQLAQGHASFRNQLALAESTVRKSMDDLIAEPDNDDAEGIAKEFYPEEREPPVVTYDAECMPAYTEPDPPPVAAAPAPETTPEDDHQAEMKKTAMATITKECMKVGIGSNQMNELMMALGHADGTVPADLNTRADLMAVYKAVKGWKPPPAPPATALDDSPPKVQPAALIADILGLIDDHDLDLNATTLRLYLPAKIEDMDEKQLKMLQKDLQTQAKGKKS